MAKRLIEYDFARAVAMLCVVAVHCLGVVDTRGPVATLYYNFGQAVCFTANAVFFMLSGRFNLTERTASDPGGFYVRKLRGIVIPVLIFFFLRTLFLLFPDYVSAGNVLESFASNSLDAFNSMEYWFVFSLISFLVVAPFLSRMVVGMLSKDRKLFFWLGLAWFALLFVMRNLGIGFSWSYLFGGFCFPFLIGPFVEELFRDGRAKRRLWVLSALAVCLSVLLFRRGVREGIFDSSPLYMLASVGFYLALVSAGRHVRGKAATTLVSFVARHSFSVYMIHMVVKKLLTPLLPSIEGIASIFCHLGFTLVVAAVSLLASVVLDALLIRPVQRAFDCAALRLGPRRASD